ncbi:MAG: tryptophanyl-tRNA synthetase [Candidatus Omnitrophota bacterium]|jgi:tryptophanyl-tRNA synthetase
MRVLSGIQPSGKLHIGNYFGMMKPALALQGDNEVFLFIANYHALTSIGDAEELRQHTIDVALDLLACGLEPEKTVLYRQSAIPEVNELAWMLSTITPMGLLERGHSFKDKTAKGIASNHALFAYPVLMAADILIVNSDIVPVGKDQKQHLEMTRDIAQKFNNRFGEVFKLPEPQIKDDVAVVPGIDGEKMSKSYNNTIDIFGESLKKTRKQIMSVITDSKQLEDPKDPDTCNVFALYKLFADEAQIQEMRANYTGGNYGYGHAKKALAELFETYFEPMRARREELEQHVDYVEDVLRKGADRAREETAKVMSSARQAMGLT